MTSSGKQEFVDRAVTDGAFSPSFSPGVMFWGTRGGEKEDLFEYYAGVFDGSSATGVVEGANIQNNDDGLLYAGRLAVNPFGGLAYSECDFRKPPEWCKLLMAFGVNGYYHQDNNRSTTLDNFDDWARRRRRGRGLARMVSPSGELHYRNDAQPNVNDNVDVARMERSDRKNARSGALRGRPPVRRGQLGRDDRRRNGDRSDEHATRASTSCCSRTTGTSTT